MKNLPTLFLCSALALTAAAVGHGSQNQEQEKSIGLGACDMTTSSVDCWNMAGVKDTSLTQRIRDFLSNSDQDINFHFGVRNVFLVVHTVYGRSETFHQGSQRYFSSIDLGPNAEGLKLVRITPEDSLEKSIDLEDNIFPAPQSLVTTTISAVPGSKAEIQGQTLTMGPSRLQNFPQDYPNFSAPQPRFEKQWILAIGSSNPDQAQYSFTLEPLDKENKPIQYVDRAGHPISSLKVLEAKIPDRGSPNPTPTPDPNNPKSKIVTAYIRSGQAFVPGAFTIETDIDPQYLGSIRISRATTGSVTIGTFPLSPLP